MPTRLLCLPFLILLAASCKNEVQTTGAETKPSAKSTTPSPSATADETLAKKKLTEEHTEEPQEPSLAPPPPHDSPAHMHAQEQGQAHGVAPVGHRFQDADQWAKRFDAKERDKWQKPASVITYMEIEEGMHVADIGAGTGYFLPYLSKAVGSTGTVLGLDIEPDMVRYMTERAEREKMTNVQARVVSTTAPKLAPKSIDRILIVDTWHHLPLRVEYAKTLAASLSPDGRIVVVDFTMKTKRGPKKSHKLAVSTIVSELEQAGLKTEVLKEELPDQYIIVAKNP